MQSSPWQHKRTKPSAAQQRPGGTGEFSDATAHSLAFAVTGPWRPDGKPTGTKQLLTPRSKVHTTCLCETEGHSGMDGMEGTEQTLANLLRSLRSYCYYQNKAFIFHQLQSQYGHTPNEMEEKGKKSRSKTYKRVEEKREQ